MKSIFSTDSFLFDVLGRAISVLTVGFIWLIFCIPIITIGASTTALYTVLYKINDNKEGYLFKQFWTAFKNNFGQSTIVFFINTIVFVIIYLDFYVCVNFFENKYQTYFFVIFFIVSLMCFLNFNYHFPTIAKFENSIKKLYVNCFKMAFGNIIFSINIAFVSALPIITLFLCRNIFVLTALFWTFIIYIFSAFIKSMLFANFFKKYE